MPNDRAAINAVALLDEPVRRALYEWVAGAGRTVSRDEAAAGVDISRALAAFHLDRLARAGLLVTEYRRLSGRTGPGAGRPSKLYRRGPREVTVSLPDRRYEVAAEIFAEMIEQLGVRLPPDALRGPAQRVGHAIGAAARKAIGSRPSQRRLWGALIEILAARGYEPSAGPSGEIRLGNCPFHALVDDHRALTCGMNLAIADGLLDGLGVRAAARLDPQPNGCCVAIGPPPARSSRPSALGLTTSKEAP